MSAVTTHWQKVSGTDVQLPGGILAGTEEILATANTTVDHGTVDDAGNFVVHLTRNRLLVTQEGTTRVGTAASVIENQMAQNE